MSKINKNLVEYEPFDSWSEKIATEKLNQLYTGVIVLSENAILWYQKYQTTKGQWSKGIRFTSILLLILSTLMPYFSSINKNPDLLYIGYVFAGVAGGFLLLDKHYGFSTSWVRFVLTKLDLENLHYLFIKKWQIIRLNHSPLTPANFIVLVEALMAFQEQINGIVKAESTTWAQEFQQNYKELMSDIKLQSEKLKAEIEKSKFEEVKNTGNDNSGNVPIEIIREAIDKHFEEWKTTFNIVAVSSGKKQIKNQLTNINCLVFSPIKKLEQGMEYFIAIPQQIKFKSVNGQTYYIPTDVYGTEGDIQSSGLCDFTLPKRPGCSISRQTVHESGTLGLRVFKGDKAYFLSCYHVLCSHELNNGYFNFSEENTQGDATVISPSNEDKGEVVKMGKVTEGLLTNELDCAIVMVDDPLNITNRVCSIEKVPGPPLTITEDHANARWPVVSVGRTSGEINGHVRYAHTNCDIKYWIRDKWQTVTMKGLIWTDQVSAGGDSGAAVLDSDNKVIGIIIANSGSFTYILPIQRILSKFSLTIN